MNDPQWSPDEATAFLLERELFGMRFELDRIRRVLIALGSPQDSFRPIHIVGTNGKTSTASFAAAILAASGRRAGGYISPHLTGFNERVLLPDGGGVRQAEPERFATAVGRAAAAARKVEKGLAEGDLVTQFELVTAAALWLLAEEGVTHAAIEAGLGGRWDATNVLRSPKVAVLTSVGLDHTRWLGPDEVSIAREKLAVVQGGDTLVVADTLGDEIMAEARARAADVGAALEVIAAGGEGGVQLSALGGFQAANFALASAAVDALAGPIAPEAIAVAAKTLVPGRMAVISREPLTILDAAHNPQGAAGLEAAIAEVTGGRPVTAVIGMLDDKDAAGFLAAMLPRMDTLVATRPLNPRALPAATIGSLASQAGMSADRIHLQHDPRAALALARTLAGRGGTVVASGSVHLVGDLLSKPGERVVSAL